jgi:hypothetical protein
MKWDKDTRKEYDKVRYEQNKETIVRQKQARRDELRKFITELKQGIHCAKCPENHPACMSFHHLRDKDFNIADALRFGYSKKRILEEMNKCIVLCMNCHTKEHLIGH